MKNTHYTVSGKAQTGNSEPQIPIHPQGLGHPKKLEKIYIFHEKLDLYRAECHRKVCGLILIQ